MITNRLEKDPKELSNRPSLVLWRGEHGAASAMRRARAALNSSIRSCVCYIIFVINDIYEFGKIWIGKQNVDCIHNVVCIHELN